MGSSCCKSDKNSKYKHSPSPNELNPKSKPKKSNSSTTSEPAPPLNSDKTSPPKDKKGSQMNDLLNIEKSKEEGNEIPNREVDSGSNEAQNRVSRSKSNNQTYDFPLKSQPKPTQNDPVDKLKGNNLNRDIKGMTNPSALNTSMGYNDDFIKVPPNSFRVLFEEKPKKKPELFIDFNETQSKHYDDYLDKKPYKDTEPASKSQSNLMEWSKALQKLINQEKSSMNILENKNKLLKAYKAVLTFKERYWYEELALLYKEKNGTKPNIMGLAFDRKTIQLQEQFKWFVGAVANTKLNLSQTVGVHEFPPFKSSTRSRRADKFDSSNTSFAKGGSQTESDIYPPFDIASPNKNQQGIQKKTLTTGLIFKPDQNDPRMNLVYEIPETTSSAWHYGFIWKGVFFRLFSKKEAHKIKKEVKALKYLSIEYFQTESTFRLFETSHGANESIDTYKHVSGQNINLLLPLVCLVEGPSWLLYATPVFPIKKSVTDDQASRLASEASNVFRSSYFLSTLNHKNFKIFNKTEEASSGSTQIGSNPLANNQFLLIHNLSRSIIRLPRIDVMFAINQDSMAHVTFFEFPEKQIIDADLIKKALGYHQQEIGTTNLLKRDLKLENKSVYLDSIKFKRREWNVEMIFVTCSSQSTLPSTYTKNKRAMDLLSHSKKHRFREIKGNVLVFACLSNRSSSVLPYFIADQLSNQSIADEILDPADLTINPKNQMNANKPKKQNYESFQSQGYVRFDKDSKFFQDYFYTNFIKSLEQVIDTLETTDSILNYESLKELFHRRGVNMRYEWIVYCKIRNERAKSLIGCDILARCLKNIINDKTHRKMKEVRKSANMTLFEVKSKIEETLNDINEFMTESFARKLLCDYLNILIKSIGESFDDEAKFYAEIQSEVFFHRLRSFDIAKRFLDINAFDNYMSAEIVNQTINFSCLSANLFIDAIQHHFKISISYDYIRQLRTDKYMHWVSAHGSPLKPSDLTMLYTPETYITVKERCFLLLLKTLPNYQSSNSEPIEFILPSTLYKLRKTSGYNESPGNSYDYLLRDYYELPDFEAINDWIVLIKGVLDGLYTPEGHQNFLIEAYLTQLTMLYFGDNDNENQLTSTILEQINTYVNTTPVCSPELLITIHTWFGLLSENKLFAECEQSYAVALLALHKLYGDPRGRGAYGTPWELFISWRLSILSRLQGKIHDAEYTEELFDATAMGLRHNPLNKHLRSHYVYTDPFREVYVGPYIKVPENLDHVNNKPNLKKVMINEHPFTYWTNHLIFDENLSKIDTINNTLQKSPQLLRWMINNLLIFQNTGILWDTAYLKDFILTIMQNSFSNTTSVSSISGLSMDRKERSGVGLDGLSTPKNGTLRFDKKEKRSGGTLVGIFEKDSSTLNKKELNGVIYSWGQNHEGQVGTPLSSVDESDLLSYQKKMKIFHPRSLIAIKDTIILSVACGHTHSMALTITRRVLAWGSNKSSQLGLGPKAPAQVYIPTVIPDFYDVAQISCGSEHTVALTTNEAVYSWGEGEGGLLGHGDTKTQKLPKMIDSLKKVPVQTIVCGGLHTVALTKTGQLYTWGRGEGGQLGLPYDQMTHDTEKGELYLATPKRIRGLIDGVFITQVACGDAHSLALAQNGLVYAWGYTSSGQLGLGISGENSDPSLRCIKEPKLVEKLANVKITDIYAGYTFSIFISDKKEPYACGLNDYSQLGIEKTVMNVNESKMTKQAFANKYNEVVYPMKIECFHKMPFLKLACGENHSVGVFSIFLDNFKLILGEGVFMLFSWGIQKHAQLGLGDIQAQFSLPRPISYLQGVPVYSIGCGAYHSLVVVGEASKSFKKEALATRLDTRLDSRWCGVYFDAKDDYAGMFDNALSNLDNIVPAEEGKIDNPKSMNKA